MKPKSPSDGVAPIPAIMTPKESDALLGVGAGYSLKLVRNGKLRASRVGKTLRIRGVDLLDFLASQPSHDADRNPLGVAGQKLPVPPAGTRFGRSRPSGGNDAA